MKRLTNKSLVQFMVFFCWILSTEIPAQTTYALVIGLSQYKEITPLQFADRDAVAFAEFLKTQRVPDNNIKLILNENATRLNVLDGMYNLTSQLKPNDRFYFYFGGHGDLEAQISSDNSLLLLYNSFKKNYFQGSEFIQLFELKDWLGDLAKKQIEVVFIADACHSGGLIGGKEGISKTQTALNENWAGITKILSCKSDEFSLEGKQWGGGRGLFSYQLVNGLIGRADANGDKKIALGELDNYLKTNVAKQANPNVQTPVVIGNSQQVLSFANTEGLEKIAELEQKNFALMTEVNTRGDDKKSLDELAKLDTTIVETYKKFAKALKEKRIAPHDDSLDCALIHYRKLEKYHLPDNLMQMVKRNMAVGLMELELTIMRNVREKGGGGVIRNEKILNAIHNLEETINIFGSNHYSYKNLQARIAILSANKRLQLARTQIIDEQLKIINDSRSIENEYLKKGLELEPNMVSTYVLLSTSYRSIKMLDSAIYYQEKVVKLLPNQAWAYFNLGYTYSTMTFKDKNNLLAPHPKAIENLEKAVALDSNMRAAYNMLGQLYMGEMSTATDEPIDSAFIRFYPEAIKNYKKLLNLIEMSDEELAKIDLKNYSSKTMFEYNPNKARFSQMLNYYQLLHHLNKASGNAGEADEYLSKIKQKVKINGSFFTYWLACLSMYEVFMRAEDELYLTYALDFVQQALMIAEEAIKTESEENKPFLTLQYSQLLSAVGVTHRALKNYNEAEKYLIQAMNFPILDSPAKGHLKLTGGMSIIFKKNIRLGNRLYTFPNLIQKINADEYHYRIEPYTEMFYLQLDQNKPEDALIWYEKALKVSQSEFGNDTSGKPFTKSILETYKNLNKEAFLKLRYKYFPNAEKVD